MLSQDEINYINKFLLKSGEELDLPKNLNNDPFVELKMIKKTERTFRVVGVIALAANVQTEQPFILDDELLEIGFTTKKKIQLNEHNPNTVKWLNHGFIIKEIRLKRDGKTVDTQHFRMGYRLYDYQQSLLRAQEEKLEQEFTSWKTKMKSFFLSPVHETTNPRDKGYAACLMITNEICGIEVDQLKEWQSFPSGWSLSKRLKFLHFITAFLQLGYQKIYFDWKEIGASYYQEIGGSKEFDRNKDDFITQLEDWAQCPITLLGMTSLGKITPLYFSGQITGRYSDYRNGPVHSLTDLSISEEDYTTNSTTLWLVENRAILTRIAAEKNFLKDTNTLMLCLDGHLRSSHKNCIKQLLTNGKITQVLLWSDYDPDGFQIAKEMYLTVKEKHNGAIRWITHTKQVFNHWPEYEVYMLDLLKDHRIEQEQVLGGAADWKKWISP
ncbi:DUF2399 domain-containing protein [Bacillus sp. EB106-08-02-XG196]|uniref:DUF2399 domain-containing protein n=1 Tax=Bacillus sp. EB106-08-02-XG196 TaxID=2737049 RepID=UPI0015C4BA5B|nr:DUF2399 domain-containing protein [Bacillus sp. EB106-08-02-XG196]NWQ42515.1 DUF2399 domain-containing protein [Bacillus sp. EB106-08-02-XG196]